MMEVHSPGPLRALCERLSGEGGREILRYLIAGVLTTLFNLVFFAVITVIFGMEHRHIFNVVDIILSIFVAYLLNRIYVFRSREKLLAEFIRFFSSRILISLLFEVGGFWFLYDFCGLKGTILGSDFHWAKALTQVFVVVGNYLVGKLFVFVSKSK